LTKNVFDDALRNLERQNLTAKFDDTLRDLERKDCSRLFDEALMVFVRNSGVPQSSYDYTCEVFAVNVFYTALFEPYDNTVFPYIFPFSLE